MYQLELKNKNENVLDQLRQCIDFAEHAINDMRPEFTCEAEFQEAAENFAMEFIEKFLRRTSPRWRWSITNLKGERRHV